MSAQFKAPLAVNLTKRRCQLGYSEVASDAGKLKQSTLNVQSTTVKHRVKASEKERATLELDRINQESAQMESGRLRSTNRANKILIGSPYQLRQEGSKTTLHHRQQKSSVVSNKTALTVRESHKCGSKRAAITKLDDLIAISQTSSPPIHHGKSKSKWEPKVYNLTLKKLVQQEGQKLEKQFTFNMYSQKDINACTKDENGVLAAWHPERLEAEFDYQTDENLLQHSKDMLTQDLFHAVDFFVKDDPLLVVQNLQKDF